MLEGVKYVGTKCNLICWNIVNHARFNDNKSLAKHA